MCIIWPYVAFVKDFKLLDYLNKARKLPLSITFFLADVAELVDALDLGSSAERRGGSSPSIRTTCKQKMSSETMEINEIKKDKLNKEFKITFPKKEIDDKTQKSIQEISRTIKMDGFRPGKVPIKLIEKKYKDSIRFEALEKEINKVVDDTIKDYELAGQPKIDNVINQEDKDVEFTLSFEILPEFDMPKFSDIKLDLLDLEISDKEIDSELTKLSDTKKEFEPISGNKTKIKKGHKVMIDFEGFKDGVAFEGGKGEDYGLIIGSNSFIPGFEDQLIGHSKDEEFSINVTFPTDYHKQELAGADVEFKIKVNDILKAKEIKIDDEFAKSCQFENLEKLKEAIRSNLKDSYQREVDNIHKMKLFDQLEKIVTFDIPQSLEDKEFEILWKQVKEIKESDEDDSLKNKTDEELEKAYRKIALRRVRVGLLLSKYAKTNKISITENDIRHEITNQAKSYPGMEKFLFEYYAKNPKAVQSLQGPIIENKSVDAILTKEVDATTKKITTIELQKIIEKQNNKELV